MAVPLPITYRIVTHPPFWTQWWTHPFDELLLPIADVYRARLAGEKKVTCPPGAGLFLPAGTRHHPLAKVGDPLVFYCCQWAPRDGPSRRKPGLVADAEGRLLYLCSWMERLSARTERSAATDRQLRRLAALVVDLIDNAVEPPAIADPLVARAVDHLLINLAEQNRVPDMAARAGLSTDGFIKRFRAATGKTPGRYLQDLRLEKALALLAGTDLTTAAIADEVGYASASHLCQLIKRRTGRLASEFR
jgi:AraC-like DNA-binding protein